MKKLIVFIAIVFSLTAQAQQIKQDLVNLGEPAERAEYYNRVIGSITTLAATGSTIADAALVPFNVLVTRVTAADGTKGVKLPLLAKVKKGVTYTIINTDVAAAALKIYSNAAGELITSQAGSTAISLASKLFLQCIKYDATNWYCSKGVLPY